MEFKNTLNFVLSFGIIYFIINSVQTFYYVFVAFAVTIFEIKSAEWLMKRTRKYVLFQRICPKNKAILITGCDSGFGNALARRMDKLGFFVYATCLNPDGEGAKRLSDECSKDVVVLPMDITDDRSIQKVKEHINRNLKQNVLWAVINNAGIAQFGEIDWTSFEELQQVYNVNAAGTLRVTKAFLPYLKESKGRIINVTSLAGRYTTPGMVGYSMSKSAANALTSGMRVELAKWGIKSISIEPHIHSTPMAGTRSILRLAEKTWVSAPMDVVTEYGEDYIDHFKKSITFCLKLFLNRHISSVIDDLEDAITAEEPLSTYIPGNAAHQFLVYLLQILPSSFNESIQKMFFSAKPLALAQKEEKYRWKINKISTK